MGDISPLDTIEVTAFGGGGHKPFPWLPLKDKSKLRDILYGLLCVAFKSDYNPRIYIKDPDAEGA